MTALDIYKKLTNYDQDAVAQRAVVLAGHPEDTAFGDVIDHEDHPALVEALREWWYVANADTITSLIDDCDEPRLRELAIILCAESVAHLTDDLRVAECRRMRLAWVSEEVTDDQRSEARDAARFAESGAANSPEMSAAWAANSDHAWTAAWVVADLMADIVAGAAAGTDAMDAAWMTTWLSEKTSIASPLRTLYPDPTRLDWRDALSRWGIAVAEAQRLMKSIADGESR